jgi:uncharacterized membrane protein
MSNAVRSSPSVWAQALGYGGLLPFSALALAVWLLAPAEQVWAASSLLGYGVTILSFLGAIHWGLTMRDAGGQSQGQLIWGVVPSLIAWLALLLPVGTGLLLLAAALWLCFAVDRTVYTRLGLRAWLPMRLLLTAVASACCVAGAWRLMGFVA